VLGDAVVGVGEADELAQDLRLVDGTARAAAQRERFIMWAKNNGIAVRPGRGSAASSIVAYTLGITDLDPIPHGLIFDRFLNPERISMPDVDIDFDERRRVEVIRYVTEKYGADKVAMIGTYVTIKAKNAIKDSARVLGYPHTMDDRVAAASVPGRGGHLRCTPGAPARRCGSTSCPGLLRHGRRRTTSGVEKFSGLQPSW
jgi:hypothetical protein